MYISETNYYALVDRAPEAYGSRCVCVSVCLFICVYVILAYIFLCNG